LTFLNSFNCPKQVAPLRLSLHAFQVGGGVESEVLARRCERVGWLLRLGESGGGGESEAREDEGGEDPDTRHRYSSSRYSCVLGKAHKLVMAFTGLDP
jgi:hypothetical protein